MFSNGVCPGASNPRESEALHAQLERRDVQRAQSRAFSSVTASRDYAALSKARQNIFNLTDGLLSGTLPAEMKMQPGAKRVREQPAAEYVCMPWPDQATEESMANSLMDHMRSELLERGVDMTVDGFALIDARRKHQFTVPASQQYFRGFADAAIVATRQIDWYTQLRVIFEWKNPVSWNAKPENVKLQAQLLLMGGLLVSNHPFLVVVTDGSRFLILQPYGKAVLVLQSLDKGVAGYVTAEEAMHFIAYHLMKVSSRNPAFKPMLDAAPEGSMLRLELQPLLAAKQAVEADDQVLIEQLGIFPMLPPEDRFSYVMETLSAWVQGDQGRCEWEEE
jgi:hypothetical protein